MPARAARPCSPSLAAAAAVAGVSGTDSHATTACASSKARRSPASVVSYGMVGEGSTGARQRSKECQSLATWRCASPRRALADHRLLVRDRERAVTIARARARARRRGGGEAPLAPESAAPAASYRHLHPFRCPRAARRCPHPACRRRRALCGRARARTRSRALPRARPKIPLFAICPHRTLQSPVVTCPLLFFFYHFGASIWAFAARCRSRSLD